MDWEIELSAAFATKEEARRALRDMEEIVGKNNGELLNSWGGNGVTDENLGLED